MLGHSQRGLKRKMEESEDDDESLYELHRESVFNISMCKLNGYRQIPDPSLRRSVLICNTLRYIESEMEQEGIQCSPIPASAGFLPAIQTDKITLDPLPPQVHGTQCYPGLPAVAEHPTQVVPVHVIGHPDKDEPLDYEKSLANLDSSGRATPFPSLQNDSCRTDSGALWSESEDRLSSINWSTVLNFSSHSETDFTTNTSNSHCTFIGGNNLSPSASSNSSSSSSSGNNEIFGDIDLSLYDFDLLPLSPPNMRLTPLSAEELLRSFPNNESIAAHPGNGCFKNEFLSEELDHIMHILVGILLRDFHKKGSVAPSSGSDL